MRKLLTYSIVLMMVGQLRANPLISSFSGDVNDGQLLKINGSGFGVHGNLNNIEWLGGKTGPIESGTVDQSIDAAGQPLSGSKWNDDLDQGGSFPSVYSNGKSHSGSQSIKSNISGGKWGSGIKYDHGTDVGKVYITWWVRVDPVVGQGGQWKMIRLQRPGNNSDKTGEIYFSQWYKPDHTRLQQLGWVHGIKDSANTWAPSYPNSNDGLRWLSGGPEPHTWTRMEVYAEESSLPDVRDGSVFYRVHKQDAPVQTIWDFQGTIITRGGSTARWRQVNFQNYWGNTSPGGIPKNTDVWFDDIYIQVGSQARVEMCAESDWNSRRHCEIQPLVSWSNGSIDITVNKGSFQDGNTSYLYVVDGNGDVNAQGYPVTWDSNSTPSPPPPPPPPPSGVNLPEAPRLTVNTDLDPAYDRRADVYVRNDCAGAPSPCYTNLQSAISDVINDVVPGTIIELKAGDVFQGNFTINDKSNSDWVYIRTSEYQNLPPPGTRVTSAHSHLMAKLVNNQTNVPVLRFNFAAHHIRIIGLEMTTAVDSNQIVILGTENQNWNTVRATNINQLPDQIIFDRVYIHAEGTKLARAGIAMDSRATAVIDSTIDNIRHHSQDTQAIQSINGAGPFRIVNNKLVSSGENLMFGGADVSINVSNGGIPVNHDSVACENPASPSTCGIVPSDVEIRGNHFIKPLTWKEGDPSWDGVNGCMKNLMEFKTGQRILMEGNIFENSWHDCGSQRGVAVKFKPTNQGGGGNTESANWDFIFRYNIIRNAGQGIALNPETEGLTQGMKRVHIHNNLVYGIGESWGSQGQGILMPIDGQSHFGEDLLIENNTMLHEPLGAPNNFGMYLAGADDGWDRVHIRNNIFSSGDGGGWAPDGAFLKGDGSSEGKPALEKYFQNYSFETNLLIRIKDNRVTPNYDSGWNIMNEWDVANVGFVDFNSQDFRLADNSPYKNAGTGQSELGADIVEVLNKTACVIAGTCDPADLPDPPADNPEDDSGSTPNPVDSVDRDLERFVNVLNSENNFTIQIPCNSLVLIYTISGDLVDSLDCSGTFVEWRAGNYASGNYIVYRQGLPPKRVVVVK